MSHDQYDADDEGNDSSDFGNAEGKSLANLKQMDGAGHP
jgi:hypothetical protein